MTRQKTKDLMDAFGVGIIPEQNSTAVTMSRPSRVPDGAGGSTLSMGAAITINMNPVVVDDIVALSVDIDEDVRVGDLLKIPRSLYQG